jgi:hypothetical protein
VHVDEWFPDDTGQKNGGEVSALDELNLVPNSTDKGPHEHREETSAHTPGDLRGDWESEMVSCSAAGVHCHSYRAEKMGYEDTDNS